MATTKAQLEAFFIAAAMGTKGAGNRTDVIVPPNTERVNYRGTTKHYLRVTTNGDARIVTGIND